MSPYASFASGGYRRHRRKGGFQSLRGGGDLDDAPPTVSSVEPAPYSDNDLGSTNKYGGRKSRRSKSRKSKRKSTRKKSCKRRR